MERQQQEKQEFKRIQNHQAYSAINPNVNDDNKNETKERVNKMGMQRRHSYDINYYKRELDHQAYPLYHPATIVTSSTRSSNISSPSSQSPTSFSPPSSSSPPSKQTLYDNENILQDFEINLEFSSSELSSSPTYDKNNNCEESNNSNNNGGKDVTEKFLFRREWDDEISKRKHKKES